MLDDFLQLLFIIIRLTSFSDITQNATAVEKGEGSLDKGATSRDDDR
jgi:hypothetical protein